MLTPNVNLENKGVLLTNHSFCATMQTKTEGGATMDEIFFGVNYLEGYEGTMPDFHSHPFYEITLVLAGNVSSLLADRALSGDALRLLPMKVRYPSFPRMPKPRLCQ
jgi:hypothetical protein